jgi:tetratricopeptide (TPR) repeat protein
VHQEQGDSLSAVTLYQEALERDPEDVSTAYNLGLLLLGLFRPQEAAGYFQMVVSRTPEDAEAWINLGVARDLLGEQEESLDAFSKALAADPRRPEPYFNLFRAHLSAGDTAAAVAMMTAYAEQDSTTRYGELARAILMRLGAKTP